MLRGMEQLLWVSCAPYLEAGQIELGDWFRKSHRRLVVATFCPNEKKKKKKKKKSSKTYMYDDGWSLFS